MEQKTMQKLEENLCEVLDDFAQKGINTAADVETVKHALSSIEKLMELDEMEQGRSGRYYDVVAYDNGGRRSYRRSYGSYDRMRSGHDIRPQLERILQDTDSERERQAIRDAISKLG